LPEAVPLVASRPAFRTASPEETAAILAESQGDYFFSQTRVFGLALQQAYREFSYDPQLAEFRDGTRVLVPAVRVRRVPRWMKVYESMPLSFTGAPVFVGRWRPSHPLAALSAWRAHHVTVNGIGPDVAVHLPQDRLEECPTEVVSLTGGFDTVWSRLFSNKARNQCRLARKRGVVVYTATRPSAMDDYYRLYAESTARWGYAAPPYPPELFSAFARLLGQGVELKLAYVDGRAVAGIVLLHGRGTTLYWSGAFLKEFAAYSPVNALLEEAIREACARGIRAFDFGASGELESVRRFKRSFGAVPVQRYSYRRARWLWRSTSLLRALVARARRPALSPSLTFPRELS
jgi:hypothetical protein